jgi:hypothetical protein
VVFELIPDGSYRQVDFTQSGHRESPRRYVCHEGWKYFLGTILKRYLETGMLAYTEKHRSLLSSPWGGNNIMLRAKLHTERRPPHKIG